MDSIGVIGASYRSTDIEKLGQAAFPRDLLPGGLRELARLTGWDELLYVATCNRVELFYSGSERCATAQLFHLRRSLADLTDGQTQLPEDSELYQHRGEEAVRHLFRVSAALDSMMVGEAQINGQVKEAYELSRIEGLLAGSLGQVLREAFRLAKRIRTETELTQRPVSIVSLVERTITDHLDVCSGPVLLVGAGEIAQQARSMVRKVDGRRPLIVANRSLDNARQLIADDEEGTAVALDGLHDIEAPALVVAATGSRTALVDAPMVSAWRRRLDGGDEIVLVDLSVPANIDPNCRDIDGVRLVTIEDLRAVAETNRLLREGEISRCDAMVEHQVEVLRRRLLDRAASSVARHLAERYEEIADELLAKASHKDLRNFEGKDLEAVENLVKTLTKRLCQVPIRGLKRAAWDHSNSVFDSFEESLESGHGNGSKPLPKDSTRKP